MFFLRICRSFFLLSLLIITNGLLWSALVLADQKGRTDLFFQAAVAQQIPVLSADTLIQKELSPGESHNYRIALDQDQFVSIAVEQQGIDVELRLETENGTEVTGMNRWDSTLGVESLVWIAKHPGLYQLKIKAAYPKGLEGKYTLKLVEVRAATETDSTRITAQQLFLEAGQYQGQETDSALRKAIETYQASLLLWQKLGDRQWEGITQALIGWLLKDLGQLRTAIEADRQGLESFRACGDQLGESMALIELGLGYRMSGERGKALEAYEQALRLKRQLGDKRGELSVLNNMGSVFHDQENYQKAIEYHLKALPLRRTLKDRKGEATTLNNIGAIYINLGEQQKAMESFEQAIQILREIGDQRLECALLANMILPYLGMNELEKAQAAFEQALALARKLGDQAEESRILNSGATVYRRQGQPQKAIHAYLQVLEWCQKNGRRGAEATVYNNLASASHQLGEPQKALDYFQQSLTIRRAIGNFSGQALNLFGMAKIECELNQFASAHAHIQEAIRIVESYYTRFTNRQLLSSFLANSQQFYEFQIDLLMQWAEQDPSGGHREQAFQVNELMRARNLLGLLQEAQADIRTGVSPELLSRERDVEQRFTAHIEAYAKLLNQKYSAEDKQKGERQLEELTIEYNDVQAQIRQHSPRYASLTQPKALTLAEIQKQVVDDNTLLLEFALGDDRSYMWAITQTTCTSYQLPPRAEIETIAEEVYRFLTTANQPETEYVKAADKLSRIVLGPVASQLRNQRLLIVADGVLHYIPFSALPKPTTPGSHTAVRPGSVQINSQPGWKPMVLDHEIISLPSVTTLAALRNETSTRREAPKRLAVLADPVFSEQDARLTTPKKSLTAEASRPKPALTSDEQMLIDFSQKALESASQAGIPTSGINLPRLAGTRKAIEKILTFVPPQQVKTAFDFDANRELALHPELSQYQIVHFATHGFLNAVNPEYSGLMLSLVDSRGHSQPGFLSAIDVYNLNLPAELVVLHACQTGLGADLTGSQPKRDVQSQLKKVRSEGLIGLTRGFMYAGAKRVMVSLWSIKEQATGELMIRFYKHLQGSKKLSPAAALRQAQIEMLTQTKWKSPSDWSGLVIQGEW
ncbi:MAG: CHAT domain-containing protein [Acidobacteria bacterium]|nr:CHAT domain-containing protein [Acidobacteriota bacterium]